MKKRVNKSKDELRAELDHKNKIAKQKIIARKIFPLVKGFKTIYDAQTAVQAIAGFIKLGIANEMITLTVKSLDFDLSKEKSSPIKDAMLAIHSELMDENADEAVALLERFANGLGQFSATQFMKNPMSKIKEDEFIA